MENMEKTQREQRDTQTACFVLDRFADVFDDVDRRNGRAGRPAPTGDERDGGAMWASLPTGAGVFRGALSGAAAPAPPEGEPRGKEWDEMIKRV